MRSTAWAGKLIRKYGFSTDLPTNQKLLKTLSIDLVKEFADATGSDGDDQPFSAVVIGLQNLRPKPVSDHVLIIGRSLQNSDIASERIHT